MLLVELFLKLCWRGFRTRRKTWARACHRRSTVKRFEALLLDDASILTHGDRHGWHDRRSGVVVVVVVV